MKKKDGKKNEKKNPYRPPRIRTERIYERCSLACGKTYDLYTEACQLQAPENS